MTCVLLQLESIHSVWFINIHTHSSLSMFCQVHFYITNKHLTDSFDLQSLFHEFCFQIFSRTLIAKSRNLFTCLNEAKCSIGISTGISRCELLSCFRMTWWELVSVSEWEWDGWTYEGSWWVPERLHTVKRCMLVFYDALQYWLCSISVSKLLGDIETSSEEKTGLCPVMWGDSLAAVWKALVRVYAGPVQIRRSGLYYPNVRCIFIWNNYYCSQIYTFMCLSNSFTISLI